MAKSAEDARKELDHEFRQFREAFGRVLTAVSDVDKATALDDVFGLLSVLEEVVNDVRTGGVFGSGAKGHREAREDYLRLTSGTH